MQNEIEKDKIPLKNHLILDVKDINDAAIPFSDNDLTFLLPEIQCNLKRYCLKTGKRLNDIPFVEIEELIKIHGIDKTIIVLKKLKQSVSTEWVITDSIGLIALAAAQPVEYFIYALAALLRKTEDKQENTMQLIKEFEEKILINEFLHTVKWEIIASCAEMVRKILSANRPIAIQEMIESFTLNAICKTEESVFKFQLVLQECWKQIKNGYYDNNIINARTRKRKALFAKQRTLTIKTELEKEISDSLDFSGIDTFANKTPEQIALLYSGASAKAKKKAIKQKEINKLKRDKERERINAKISLNDIKPTIFIKLKIGGK